MDIEQLKLILETLQSAGEGAFTFGIWWLVAGIIPNVLLFIFGLVAIWAACRAVVAIVYVESAFHAIATALGYRTSAFRRNDAQELVALIHKLQQQAESKQSPNSQ